MGAHENHMLDSLQRLRQPWTHIPPLKGPYDKECKSYGCMECSKTGKCSRFFKARASKVTIKLRTAESLMCQLTLRQFIHNKYFSSKNALHPGGLLVTGLWYLAIHDSEFVLPASKISLGTSAIVQTHVRLCSWIKIATACMFRWTLQPHGEMPLMWATVVSACVLICPNLPAGNAMPQNSDLPWWLHCGMRHSCTAPTEPCYWVRWCSLAAPRRIWQASSVGASHCVYTGQPLEYRWCPMGQCDWKASHCVASPQGQQNCLSQRPEDECTVTEIIHW